MVQVHRFSKDLAFYLLLRYFWCQDLESDRLRVAMSQRASTYCSRQLFSSSNFFISYLTDLIFLVRRLHCSRYLFNSVTIYSRLSVFRFSLSKLRYFCLAFITSAPILSRIFTQVLSISLSRSICYDLNIDSIQLILTLTSLYMSSMLGYYLVIFFEVRENVDTGVEVWSGRFSAARDFSVLFIQLRISNGVFECDQNYLISYLPIRSRIYINSLMTVLQRYKPIKRAMAQCLDHQ